MQKRLFSFFILFLIFSLVIAGAGCSPSIETPGGTENQGTEQSGTEQPGAGQPDTDKPGEQGGGANASPSPFERYMISMTFGASWNQSYWVVDRDGVTIPEEEQFTVLRDVLSGEPQCLVLTRHEKISENEYGGIIDAEFSAVFDLDGNMIINWDEYNYYNGFGDFIIRQQSWHSFEETMGPQIYDGEYREPKRELLDFRNNKAFIDGVSVVDRIDDVTALLSDFSSRPLGVVDNTGTKQAGFPVPDKYAYARPWNGYIIATNQSVFSYEETPKQQAFLLTPEFEELLSYETLQESYTSRLLKYTDGAGTENEKRGIIRTDGTELYKIRPGEDVVYFDEDFVIISYEDYSTPAQPGSGDYYPVYFKYKIINITDGTVIIDGASAVAYNLDYDYSKPSGNILVYEEETLKVLNREEGFKAQKEVPGIYYMNLLNESLFCINVDIGEYDYLSMILDQDLNEVVPMGIYSNLRQGVRWDGKEYKYFDILIGERQGDRSTGWFSDLLNLKGEVLVEGLNGIFDVGYDRIAVRKGFNVGLMDWQGNWIAKRSVFSELQDD